MKKIKYKGSLTEDLKLINSNYEDDESLNGFLIFSRALAAIMFILFMLMVALRTINISLIASLITTITSMTIISSTRKMNMSNHEFKKMNAKQNISSLIFELLKLKKDEEIKKDSVYEIDDIVSAVVIPMEDKKEDITTDDVADYLDEITNDIYVVNKEAKIMVLREVKSVIKSEEKDKYVSGTATLYELDEDDILKQGSLPVKHVLRLRDDNNERSRI